MDIGVVGTGYVGSGRGGVPGRNRQPRPLRGQRRRQGRAPSGGRDPHLRARPRRDGASQRRPKSGSSFTTDLEETVRSSEVIFIAVGTPQGEDGSADLKHVLAVARGIGEAMDGDKIIVNKSTVPVGTAAKVREVISGLTEHRVSVVSNPEFLKEGHGGRRLPPAGPGGHRHRRPGGGGGHAAPVPALRPDRQAHPGDGPAVGGADEVRGQRHARQPDLLHERDRQLLRSGGRRRSKACGWAWAPTAASGPPSCFPGVGYGGLVLPEGRQGPHPDGPGGRASG